MLKHVIAVAALAVALGPAPASAIDLDALSVMDRRCACVAYGLIDLEMRRNARTIDKAVYDDGRNQLMWKIMNRGDNFNYAREFRRVEVYGSRIVDENPSPEAFAAQVATCRSFLRL
jgi:hypothetical protein